MLASIACLFLFSLRSSRILVWYLFIKTWYHIMKLWILFKPSLLAAFFSDITSAGDEAGTTLYCQMWTENKVSRGMGWRGRWAGRLGWGTHVNPWLIHVNVWQKPLQYCKVISLQWTKINGKIKEERKKVKKTGFLITPGWGWFLLAGRSRSGSLLLSTWPPRHPRVREGPHYWLMGKSSQLPTWPSLTLFWSGAGEPHHSLARMDV